MGTGSLSARVPVRGRVSAAGGMPSGTKTHQPARQRSGTCRIAVRAVISTIGSPRSPPHHYIKYISHIYRSARQRDQHDSATARADSTAEQGQQAARSCTTAHPPGRHNSS